MHGFSTVDGFVEINECLAEMIKYLANEPSLGLYYVQQHTQNAVPNVISLRDNLKDKSHQTNLHTQDFEDSITMLSSMKECGFPIVDEIIQDIKKSLTLINNPSSSFHIKRTSSWGPSTWVRTSGLDQQDTGNAVNLFSNVYKSAKETASNLKWPAISATSVTTGSAADNTLEEKEVAVETNLPDKTIALVSDTYETFKADREAKLQEWLEGSGNNHDSSAQ
ncbi:hypothetical protein ACFE04_026024 [Oxalis oulophora]